MSLLKKFITEPLFHFKENTLNPLVANLAARIDAADKADGISSRIEQLLAVREETETSLTAAGKDADKKGWPSVAAFALGLVLMTGTAIMAPAAALSLPVAALFYSGIGLATLGLAGVMKTVSNVAQAGADKNTLEGKIDGEIRALAQTAPEQAIQSPRFVKAIANGFNGSASPAARSVLSYEELVKRAAPKAPSLAQ